MMVKLVVNGSKISLVDTSNSADNYEDLTHGFRLAPSNIIMGGLDLKIYQNFVREIFFLDLWEG